MVKVVILAGGFGTRISEESHLKPKPMVEIGEKPILWHIMKLYSSYGYYDFIICCGYKQYMIKEYFADYYLHNSDVTFDFRNNGAMKIHTRSAEPWKVTLVDTGLNTMTGGRIKRIEPYIGNEPFMLTYGDGISDIDINTLAGFHKTHGKIGTITAISVDQHFGVLDIEDSGLILSFREKSDNDRSIINAGFMVFNPEVFERIKDDNTVFEKEPLESLVADGQLIAYRHKGFWQCMDTLRDKQILDDLWGKGEPPWKIW